MNSIDFFKAFFVELINELDSPVVCYEGYAEVVERDCTLPTKRNRNLV
jgi:hypothetical protein